MTRSLLIDCGRCRSEADFIFNWRVLCLSVDEFLNICRPTGLPILNNSIPGLARFALTPGYFVSRLRREDSDCSKATPR